MADDNMCKIVCWKNMNKFMACLLLFLALFALQLMLKTVGKN